MKERFSKIFVLWNRRNTGFYQDSFYEIKTKDKISFNYIAAFFPFAWLIFRKMYKWAMLSLLVFGVTQTIALAVFPKSRWIIFLVLNVIAFLCFGFLGNLLYYEDTKSKVSKGYAEIEEYNPIDPLWSVLFIVLPYLVVSGFFTVIMISVLVIWNISPSDQTIIFVLNLLQLLLIAIPWAIDYKKFHSQESTEPKAVTEESINKYLDKANPKCMFMAMWIWISGLILVMFLSILSVSVTKAIGNKIKNQLDKIAVEMEEDSKKSKISAKIENLEPNKVRRQLGNISKYRRKASSHSGILKNTTVEIQNRGKDNISSGRIGEMPNNSENLENNVNNIQEDSSSRENKVDEMQDYSEASERNTSQTQDEEVDILTNEINDHQNDSENSFPENQNEEQDDVEVLEAETGSSQEDLDLNTLNDEEV